MAKNLMIVGIIFLSFGIVYGVYEFIKYNQEREVIYANILATNIEPIPITIDTKKEVQTISPLLFGGTHTPLTNHIDAWNKIQEAGVTSIRRDFFMDLIVPRNITLRDYITNKNNVQNPDNWNQTMIRSTKERYRLAKERGMTTMGIVDYSPPWLTHNGKVNGVPKDWAIFRDIVKKHYLLFRDDIDYLEVWNEPTYEIFNDVKGTDLTMEESYKLMAKSIIEVVRKVDQEKNDGKHVKLGGLVANNPNQTKMLRAILDDEYIKSNLDFISYHTYDHPEPTSEKYYEVLKEYGLGNMPVFITEWNYDTKETTDSPYKTGDEAMIYTADKLFNMMEQGIDGANYFMLEPAGFNTPGTGVKFFGFYMWENEQATLLPQAKTWRLLSKSLDLGSGLNIMTDNSHDTSLRVISFINSKGQNGITILNPTKEQQVVRLDFSEINASAKHIKIFVASTDNDGSTPTISIDVPIEQQVLSQSVLIPSESLIGVLITDDVSLLNKIRFKLLPSSN